MTTVPLVYGMKSVNVAPLLNLFSGTTNMLPLLGAFLSDTYWGAMPHAGPGLHALLPRHAAAMMVTSTMSLLHL
jgi:hypothetical protein